LVDTKKRNFNTLTDLKNTELENIELPWTTEHLLSLAENEHHARTSRNFAVTPRWKVLGQSEGVVWGRYPNKDKEPIETFFSVPNLSFSCSCSHRLFPCYHAFGLVLLYSEEPAAFIHEEQPEWVSLETEISKKRTKSSKKKDAKRLADLRAGLGALELWQRDVVKDGLETVRKQPHKYWSALADRLLDARAGDLAAEVRGWSRLSSADPLWAETLLKKMGRLSLLIEGFKALETLPESVQADLKAAVGWPGTPQEKVLDTWHVLGRRSQQLGVRKEQRIWLWGEESGRSALLVYVKQGRRKVNTSLLTGLSVRGELTFYPGSAPLRAELEPGFRLLKTTVPSASHASVKEALAGVGDSLARNPWRTLFPLSLSGLNADRSESGWFVSDAEGYVLPLPAKFTYGWQLRALGIGARSEGGLELFGEWDGETFRPLSLCRGGQRLDMNILRGIK